MFFDYKRMLQLIKLESVLFSGLLNVVETGANKIVNDNIFEVNIGYRGTSDENARNNQER